MSGADRNLTPFLSAYARRAAMKAFVFDPFTQSVSWRLDCYSVLLLCLGLQAIDVNSQPRGGRIESLGAVVKTRTGLLGISSANSGSWPAIRFRSCPRGLRIAFVERSSPDRER